MSTLLNLSDLKIKQSTISYFNIIRTILKKSRHTFLSVSTSNLFNDLLIFWSKIALSYAKKGSAEVIQPECKIRAVSYTLFFIYMLYGPVKNSKRSPTNSRKEGSSSLSKHLKLTYSVFLFFLIECFLKLGFPLLSILILLPFILFLEIVITTF